MGNTVTCLESSFVASYGVTNNIKSRTLKTGKVVSAFAAGGKSNGAKLLVKTPSAYVSSYTSLFKGEGLLNQKAKVQAA